MFFEATYNDGTSARWFLEEDDPRVQRIGDSLEELLGPPDTLKCGCEPALIPVPRVPPRDPDPLDEAHGVTRFHRTCIVCPPGHTGRPTHNGACSDGFWQWRAGT